MSREYGAIKRGSRLHPPTQADYERQTAAAARQAEEEQRRAAARRQRQRGTALSLLLDEEEDVFVDFGLDGDVDGVPQPASSSQRQRPTASGQQQRRSHTENVRRREETWRTVDQHDIAVSVACAEELARYREEDVQLLVSATQQRVDACASCPPHPCPGGTVQRTGERLVILRTLLGSGVLRVPQFSCSSCGELELSPAAVGCQRSSPNPACWFDHWLCSAAQHFTTSGGLAMATFCTCVDAMAAAAEQLSAEPCASPSLSERQLAAAVRHRTYVQRNYLDPARHGAAIFAGPLGHCPPCAGAMLARGAPEVPRAVPAEEASAAIPSPLAASSGVMLQQEARHAAASAQPPGVAGQPQRQQSPPPLPQQQQLDLGSMDLLGSSAEAGGGGEHGGSLLPPQQQGSSVRACPSAAQPGGAATSTQLPELSSMAAARAPATAREAALFSALVPNDSAGGNRESGTHPPRPSAPSLDPALAWLPPHLAPLEGELAFLKDATGSLDYAARAQLAQALRVDPGPLSRIAQARVWQRGQLLLLDGQLVQPWGASVTPRQLKDWFRELAAGVNLGNTQNKEALANKAAAHLVAEVYALPVSVEAARQRITSLLAGAAAARAASVQPMQAAAPHSVVQLGAVSQMGALPHLGGTLQLGGRPHSMMPALPLGLAPGMPQGMPLAANVWQQLAASAGIPYVSDVAAAAAAGYQPLSSFYFQGS